LTASVKSILPHKKYRGREGEFQFPKKSKRRARYINQVQFDDL